MATESHPLAPAPAEVLVTWKRRRRLSVRSILAGIVVLALLVGLGIAIANGRFSWHVVGHYLSGRQIMKGVGLTIFLTAASMGLGIALGIITGVARLSANVVVSSVAWLYVWFFRGTPVLIQLLLWFNIALVFPSLGLPGVGSVSTNTLVTPIVAAILGLGVNEGAYVGEIVRGGITSVDEGQREAALAIGASHAHMYRRIILPQAIRVIIPIIGNETIGMLKTTALVSIIAVQELLGSAQQIYFVNGAIMELLIVASVWYLLVTSVFSIGQYYLERYFGRSLQRTRPRALVERIAIGLWQGLAARRERTT